MSFKVTMSLRLKFLSFRSTKNVTEMFRTRESCHKSANIYTNRVLIYKKKSNGFTFLSTYTCYIDMYSLFSHTNKNKKTKTMV